MQVNESEIFKSFWTYSKHIDEDFEATYTTFIIYTKARKCIFCSMEIDLTPAELDFLLALATRANQVVDYHILLGKDEVKEGDSEYSEKREEQQNTARVFKSKIINKLKTALKIKLNLYESMKKGELIFDSMFRIVKPTKPIGKLVPEALGITLLKADEDSDIDINCKSKVSMEKITKCYANGFCYDSDKKQLENIDKLITAYSKRGYILNLFSDQVIIGV